MGEGSQLFSSSEPLGLPSACCPTPRCSCSRTISPLCQSQSVAFYIPHPENSLLLTYSLQAALGIEGRLWQMTREGQSSSIPQPTWNWVRAGKQRLSGQAFG